MPAKILNFPVPHFEDMDNAGIQSLRGVKSAHEIKRFSKGLHNPKYIIQFESNRSLLVSPSESSCGEYTLVLLDLTTGTETHLGDDFSANETYDQARMLGSALPCHSATYESGADIQEIFA